MFTGLRDLWYKIPKSSKSGDEYEWVPLDYKEYQTTYSFNDGGKRVGLLGLDGNPITPPNYQYIEALGPDRFRCYYGKIISDGEGLSVLINNRGETIKP